eukprot:4083451-Lingulodinium_polyedra.AAC.1
MTPSSPHREVVNIGAALHPRLCRLNRGGPRGPQHPKHEDRHRAARQYARGRAPRVSQDAFDTQAALSL